MSITTVHLQRSLYPPPGHGGLDISYEGIYQYIKNLFIFMFYSQAFTNMTAF